jgi:predicted methyltransferase
MGYRAWARAGTALLIAATPHFSAFAQSAAPSTTSPAASPTIVPVLNPAAQSALQKAIGGNQRIEPTRDRWRNPAATLQFFGVRPTDTVIEVWPGQGWYTSILGPYLKQGSGNLVIGHFDASSTNSSVVRQIVDAYRARFASDQGTYGSVSVVPFGPRSGPLGLPGTADSVLTFRNIHNWMAQGWAEKAFGDFFLVLKPGGILGVEEHRGRTDEPQDPLARDGYVREDYVIQLAREAGFEFIGRSEINANPADTKDHPFGVWTLPPVSRTSVLGQRDDPGFDRTRFDAIGESDRMTLRFRKPLNAIGGPPPPGTRWSPVIVAPAPQVSTPTTIAPLAARPSPPIVRPITVPPSVVSRPTPIVSPVAPPSPPVVLPKPVTPLVPPAPRNSEAASPRNVEPPPRSAPVRTLPPLATPPPGPTPAAIVPQLSSSPIVAQPTEALSDKSVIASPPSPTSPPIVEPRPALVPASATLSPQVSPPAQLPPIVESNPLAPIETPVVAPVETPAVSPVPLVAAPPASGPIAAKPAVPTSPPSTVPPIRSNVTRSPVAPAAAALRPLAPPPAKTPPVLRPASGRPTTSAPVRPSPPALATPRTPRPTASPVAGPAPRPRAPAARPPAVSSPARPASTAVPATKAKPKAQVAPIARPTTRPPPSPKAKAPPPPPNPDKPDWVVPRRRS